MKLVIIGKSGQGKVVADIAAACGYADIIYLDDNAELGAAGPVKDFEKYIGEAEFVVAIGNSKTRELIADAVSALGGAFATLVHPSAVISPSVEIGEGTVIMPRAVVNASAYIGKHCIINTSAVVEHDCIIGDYTHVSVGSAVAGTCVVGKHVWLGIGAVVSNNLSICDGAYIGAGAAVIRNIETAGKYYGVPAVLQPGEQVVR